MIRFLKFLGKESEEFLKFNVLFLFREKKIIGKKERKMKKTRLKKIFLFEFDEMWLWILWKKFLHLLSFSGWSNRSI